MNVSDLIHRELPQIAGLVRGEAQMQSARRGRPVSLHDPLVQDAVASRILAGEGLALRRRLERYGKAHERKARQ